MSYILSADEIIMPETFNEEQYKLNLGVTEIEDVIAYGQITDCNSGEPIITAIVKALFTNPSNGELEAISHTFSGCDGYYMLHIPPTVEYMDYTDPENPVKENLDLANQTITIQAVGTDITEIPCICPGTQP